MATAPLRRLRRLQVGAGRLGSQRPPGLPRRASLALGRPMAGRRLSWLGCLGSASLLAEQTTPPPASAPAPLHSVGACMCRRAATGDCSVTEEPRAARATGVDGNVSRSKLPAARLEAFPELGLYSQLGLNIERYLVTRSKGNTFRLVGRNPAPGQR